MAGLTYYADNYDHVLAPSGWVCAAAVGMDGSGDIAITDPEDSAAAVHLETVPACVGCALDLVCPLFVEAAQMYQQQDGTACPPNPGETVLRQSANLARFVDPAGITGSGDPSGGPYAVIGSGVFVNSGGQLSAYKLSCSLPDAVASYCVSIIADFEVGYGAVSQ